MLYCVYFMYTEILLFAWYLIDKFKISVFLFKNKFFDFEILLFAWYLIDKFKISVFLFKNKFFDWENGSKLSLGHSSNFAVFCWSAVGWHSLFIALLHHWWYFVIRVTDWTNDICHSDISSFMLLISSLRISTKLYLRHLFGLHLLW